MLTLFSILILGFLLGMRHATDPDHVIAVTTLVTRERSVWSAARLGVLWGLGHTITILLVGGAIIVFGIVIPPRAGLTLEFAVAIMLIVLGLTNLRGILRGVQATVGAVSASLTPGTHAHPHRHGEPQTTLDRWLGTLALYQVIRPVLIGIVHGLAGSAALALLVLTTISSAPAAIAYLVVFGVGTIAGMMLITAAVGAPIAYTAQRFSAVNRYLGVASSVLSLAFGLFLAYDIGVVGGLFTAHPSWTPR